MDYRGAQIQVMHTPLVARSHWGSSDRLVLAAKVHVEVLKAKPVAWMGEGDKGSADHSVCPTMPMTTRRWFQFPVSEAKLIPVPASMDTVSSQKISAEKYQGDPGKE